MQKIKFLIPIILIVGLFLILNRKSQTTKPQYQTSQVQKGTIIASVSTSGKVVTSNIININSGATGIIKKVYVQDGTKVYAGEKLAEITLDQAGQQKNASAWSSYLSAKNSLDSTNTNLYTLQSTEFAANQKFINDAVARNLATNDPTYIQENASWLAAESNYNNQQNVINQAKANLGSSWLAYQQTSPIITAPTSGTFYNTSLVEGISVSAASLGTIQNSTNPILSFDTGEVDVAKIKVGQKATITFDSITDKTFTGHVVTLDKIGTISNNVTTYPIIIVLDTVSNEILPNMAATANIIIDTKTDVLVVPTSAIQTQNGSSTVRILKNGQVQNVDVVTGLSSDTQIQISSGLQEGDTIVTSVVTQRSSSGSNISSPFGSTRGFGGGR